MSIFEACMVVMAVSTAAGALSTVAKNIAHTLGVKKATKLAEDATVGAQVGAFLGGAIEAVLRPAAAKRVEQLEANEKARQAILDDLLQALKEARAQRDARGTLAEQVVIWWRQLTKKKEGK